MSVKQIEFTLPQKLDSFGHIGIPNSVIFPERTEESSKQPVELCGSRELYKSA